MNGDLKLVVHDGCFDLGKKIERHLMDFRNDETPLIVKADLPRFGDGASKCVLEDTVRGSDLFILVDVTNYSLKFKVNVEESHFGPDNYFMDTVGIIGAAKGHTNRTSVVMPFLIYGRQHRRKVRESLNCAIALQILHNFLGVHTIITVDAHDPDICNALPLSAFENVYPTASILKNFVGNESKKIDFNNLVIISPDAGAIERANFYANVFQTELGIFTKLRAYNVTEGRNKITMHRYSGSDLEGKDAILIDDMIASGDSIFDTARQIKERKARNVYLITTFPLFTVGIENVKKAYEEKIFTKLYTTNLSYIPEEYKKEPWIEVVDCSLILAKIINAINLNKPISQLLDGKAEIASHVDEQLQLIRKPPR